MPPKAEELAQLCQQGFEDGLRFLQRNNLISCQKCVSIQSRFLIQAALPEVDDTYDPECKDCTAHRKIASKANLPDTVTSVLHQAMESANKGILSWLFGFRDNKSKARGNGEVSSERPETQSHSGLSLMIK